jgi:RNA polymerase sigma factor (sigma-70 family)
MVQQLETLTDPVLWTRARGGEKSSFEELVRRYARSVYAIAVSILSDPEAAEDASQEAFTRAWEHRSSCGNPSRVGAWLLGIARNCAREALRTRRREAPILARHEEPLAPEETGEDRIGEVVRALASLEVEARALLTMKYQEVRSVKTTIFNLVEFLWLLPAFVLS